MNKIFVVFSVVAFATFAFSYPTGAPQSSCEPSSAPRHGNHSAQTSPAPVKIVLSETKVKPGQSIEIKVEGIESSYAFMGFLIQVRTIDTKELVGTMEVTGTDAQILDCNGPNSVTHTNRDMKKSVIVNWKAPELTGDMKVHLTIVQSFALFWTDLVSETIEVS